MSTGKFFIGHQSAYTKKRHYRSYYSAMAFSARVQFGTLAMHHAKSCDLFHVNIPR
jgi:hypothetical protein